MDATVQILTSTKHGFKICTAQMAFNLVINTELKNRGKKEQIHKKEQRIYVLQHYGDVRP
jgi:hypothetical protein